METKLQPIAVPVTTQLTGPGAPSAVASPPSKALPAVVDTLEKGRAAPSLVQAPARADAAPAPRPGGSPLAAVFTQYVGPNAIAELVRQKSELKVILLSGKSMTGKSTQTAVFAKQLGRPGISTGGIVEERAKVAGLTKAEYAKKLGTAEDVGLDYEACRRIMAGEVAVLDGRLAGHLGVFLRGLGRDDIFTIQLDCSPREQALRFINREFSPEVRAEVEQRLVAVENEEMEKAKAAGKDPNGAIPRDLQGYLQLLAKVEHPAVKQVTPRIETESQRDARDRARLQGLYGVDFTDASVFDLVLDTTKLGPEQVSKAIRAALPIEWSAAR